MSGSVYCLCDSETKANAILMHLRNVGMGSQISVMLTGQPDTKDITLQENAIRGAGFGGLAGALVALTVPGLGPILAMGPLAAALAGAIAGGAVGGLAGGSGAFKLPGLPDDLAARLRHPITPGNILIAVHSEESAVLQTAVQVFRSEGAPEIYIPAWKTAA